MTLADNIRKDFPILNDNICFLDSGASAQKPQCVIDKQEYFTKKVYANVHRGTYSFSAEITDAYEQARTTVANFINSEEREVIFTKNATESINLVANSFGTMLNDGDEIIISEMEHHANIVSWQLLQSRQKQYGKNITIKVCPVLDNGELDLEQFKNLLNEKTALVAITHTSNVLGTVVDVKTLANLTHGVNAKILVDGSQAIMHQKVDVKDLDVDFYVFTGHKIYAPTGVGVLWGRAELLESMPPFLGGGDMIESVSFDGTTFAKIPAKFEAGTPPIVPVICLGTAINYINQVGIDKINSYETDLYAYLLDKIRIIPNIVIIGTAEHKAPILSFIVKDIHSYDIAEILNNYKVCVRVGHHCAEPLMKRFNINSTIRASMAFYNTKSDIDHFVDSLAKAIKMLG